MMKRDHLAGPMILLLLTVLLPSVGMVWMLGQVVRNQRAASDKRLKDAYRIQLEGIGQAVTSRWTQQTAGPFQMPLDSQGPAAQFAAVIDRTGADSALILDDHGAVLYPAATRPTTGDIDHRATEPTAAWRRIEQLEFGAHDYVAAAEAFGEIAQRDASDVVRAQARQGQVRCWLKLDRTEAAIETLKRQTDDVDDWNVYDSAGRSFAAAAQLRLLELMDRDSDGWDPVAQRLTERLTDYQHEAMAPSQRRFLMTRLQQLSGHDVTFPLQAAESLAAQWMATQRITAQRMTAQRMTTRGVSASIEPTPLPDVWCQRSSDRRQILLYRTDTLRQQIAAIASERPLPQDVEIAVTQLGQPNTNFAAISLGKPLSGWRLGASLPDDALLLQTSRQRNVWHGWIACLIVAVTGVLSALLARSLRRRLQLAQLKNDLVATVSHELKTPLASIRLLVDTLLDPAVAKSQDGAATAQPMSARTVDYLQLISHENARLTRLIDGFLTFSRIAGGKHNVDFQTTDVREVIQQAASVFGESHDGAEECLQVQISRSSSVSGDADLLVIAVVNLLENAWKYSDDRPRITLTADVTDRQTTISVGDNGIGMHAQHVKHVFDQFYQVDQRLTRSRDGCGLGLSIVRSIVQAHGGSVDVTSQVGVGSTFTISLPSLATDDAATHDQDERERSL